MNHPPESAPPGSSKTQQQQQQPPMSDPSSKNENKPKSPGSKFHFPKHAKKNKESMERAESNISALTTGDDMDDDFSVGSMENHNHTNVTSSSVSTLKSEKFWYIVSPPPANSVKGHLLPPVAARINRQRRLSVEVHTVPSPISPSSTHRTSSIQSHQPPPQERPLPSSTNTTTGGDLGSSRTTMLRSLSSAFGLGRESRSGSEGEYEEVYVVMKSARKSAKKAAKRMAKHVMDDASDNNADAAATTADDDGDIWVTKYKIPLADFVIKHRIKTSCIISAKVKSTSSHSQTRELIFRSEREAEDFMRHVKEQKSQEVIRGEKRLKAALGGIELDQTENLEFLIEVVSGIDLPVADLKSSDPYVEVLFDGRTVHKTDYISRNLDPVWTLKTKSLFLLNVSAQELFQHPEGVTFKVMDYDQVGSDETLGAVMISPKALYEAQGERVEYRLRPVPGKKDRRKGKLAIRVRRATKHDKEFMEKLRLSKANPAGTLRSVVPSSKNKEKEEAQDGGASLLKTLTTKNKKVEKKETLYRIRPSPDPKRPEATKWMTKQQIETEVSQESTHWYDVGSGNLGKLYIEVLGCDDLPNLDTGSFAGNKTDAFVNIVYEDCVIDTDIIDDSLNPRWLPWSKRAFIFHMMHSSSQLFLGVFDHDTGTFDDHDLIGRVSVDLSNLRANTEYYLDYDIYPTARMSDRVSKGKVHIRLRMEVDDERTLLLSNLDPPPVVHVNTKKKKNFKTARYTCQGKHDFDVFSMKTISAYVEELVMYLEALVFLEDALTTLILWRGHFPLRLRMPKPWDQIKEVFVNNTNKFSNPVEDYTVGKTVLLPLHSINMFIFSVILVEHPTLLPSFFFASIAWMLLGVMGWRRKNPSPWLRCKSFGELFRVLVLGDHLKPHTIQKDENKEEAEAFQERIRKRLEEAEKESERKRLKALEEQEEYEKELEEIGETEVDISTKKGGVSVSPLAPFKGVLFPVQQYLAITVDCLRFVKNVIIWEECYFAFWICVGSLTLSVAMLFVPWKFLIKWLSRLTVWLIFGPWMKLVDIYYVQKILNMTEEEKLQQQEEEQAQRRALTEERAREARITRENAAKLKDMKKYLFGRFIVKVPILKLDRFRDIPLTSSRAKPYEPAKLSLAELAMKEAGMGRTRVQGQHLVGDMIPVIESPEMTDAPAGQPARHRSLLESGSPGQTVTKDDDVTAMMKVGAVVVAAGAITWFGVPLMKIVVGGTGRWIWGLFWR